MTIYFIKVERQETGPRNVKKTYIGSSRAEHIVFEVSKKFNDRSEDMHINSPNKVSSYSSNKRSNSKQQPRKPISSHLRMSTYKSATILIFIVVLFLLTHFYRVTLKIYEISTPKNNMKDFTFCLSKNR